MGGQQIYAGPCRQETARMTGPGYYLDYGYDYDYGNPDTNDCAGCTLSFAETAAILFPAGDDPLAWVDNAVRLAFVDWQCSGSGCLVEAAGILPVGKLAKGVKWLRGLFRWGDEAADAARLGDDLIEGAADATKGIDDFAAGLARPTVGDPKLNQLMDELYRPGATTGSGSTADAVRYELQTGLQVGGRSHIQKAGDMARALENWLGRNPDALTTDRAAAQSVIDDLWNALDGN
jgi:hypothetical protein